MNNPADDIITPDIARTLYGLFQERVRRTPNGAAYKYFDDAAGIWRSNTWAEMSVEVERWRTALNREGLKPGDRIAIWICNCMEWVIMDQAALGLGLVVVPLFCNDRAENVAYMLNDAEVKLLLIDDIHFWKDINAVPDKPRGLTYIISLRKFDTDSYDSRLRFTDEWLPVRGEGIDPPQMEPNDLATIVYTSGTTGHPKGVRISHKNILWNALRGIESVPVNRDDIFLSFLPISHMFERTVGYYTPMMAGATVVYTRSVKHLADDFTAIRPTVIVSVPRIFEKVYAAINEKLEQKSALARRLFDIAVNTGWDRFNYFQRRSGWRFSFLLWPLLDVLVAKKIRERFGGRLRTVVVGGAPLSDNISKVFIGVGLPLLQGYGMTELGPVVSVNRHNDNIPGSVGLPYKDVEIKTGEDDELLVRSPGVMLGYLNNADATAEAIDGEGWLHTGDRARTEDRHIFITGRIKEIIVLSNGEKLPPHDIEAVIDMDPLIEQVMIVGEGKPYLSALIVLDEEHGKKAAAGLGINMDKDDYLKDKRLEQLLLNRISSQMHEFPGYAKVNRVVILAEPWTVENELITPTLKLRRKKILERFSEDVHRLYEGYNV